MDEDPALYLGACNVIDIGADAVRRQAAVLAATDQLATVVRCFRFVRDEIKHSADHQLNPVTCCASEVLLHGTGFCYAKSHLLCALLRANGIAAGMCYQRLSLDSVGPPFCLHGLNAVYLTDYGWYRIDARGNRQDVDAQCLPPNEQLAFVTQIPGECDVPGVFAKPLPVVVEALRQHTTWDSLSKHLPDIENRVN